MKRNLFSAIFCNKKIKIFLIIFFIFVFFGFQKTYALFVYNDRISNNVVDEYRIEQNTYKKTTNTETMDGLVSSSEEILNQEDSNKIQLKLDNLLNEEQAKYSKEYTKVIKENYIDPINNLNLNDSSSTEAIKELQKIFIDSSNFFKDSTGKGSDYKSVFTKMKDSVNDSFYVYDISTILTVQRRVYLYKRLDEFLKNDKNKNLNPKLLKLVEDLKKEANSGGFFNFSPGQNDLKPLEISPTLGYGAAIIKNLTFSFSIDETGQVITDPTTGGVAQESSEALCSPGAGF